MYESSSLCLWHHVSTSHNYSFAVILMIMLLSFTQANWYRGQWRAKIHIKEGSTFDSPGQNETVSWTNSPTYICLTMPSRDVYISSFKVYFKYELQRCNPREGYFISCCCKVLMTFAMWRWMICNCSVTFGSIEGSGSNCQHSSSISIYVCVMKNLGWIGHSLVTYS